MANSEKVTLSRDRVIVQANEMMYKIFLQNCICKRGNEFYCYLCKFESNSVKTMLEHISHEEHQKEYKARDFNFDLLKNLTENKSKREIIFNGIVLINTSWYYCSICDCFLASVIDHVQGQKHSKKIDYFIYYDTYIPNNDVKNNNSQGIEHDFEDDTDLAIVHYCTVCKVSLNCDAALKHHKMWHLNLQKYSYKNIDIISFAHEEHDKRSIHCFICECDISNEQQLESHLKDVSHKRRMSVLNRPKTLTISRNALEPFVIKSDKINHISCERILKYLYCQICNILIDFNDTKEFDAHLKAKQHQENKLTFFQQNKIPELIIISKNCSPKYTCFLCNVEFDENKLLFVHYDNEVHKYRAAAISLILQDKNINIDISNENLTGIQCIPCNTNTTDLQTIVNHVLECSHKETSKQYIRSPVKNIGKLCDSKLNYQPASEKSPIEFIIQNPNEKDKKETNNGTSTLHNRSPIRNIGKLCDSKLNYQPASEKSPIEVIIQNTNEKNKKETNNGTSTLYNRSPVRNIGKLYDSKPKCLTTSAKNTIEFILNEKDKQETNIIVGKGSFIYSCPLYKVNLPHYTFLLHHLLSMNSKVKADKTVDFKSLTGVKFPCPIYNETFGYETQLLEHLYDIKHVNKTLSKLNNINKLFNSSKKTNLPSSNDTEAKSENIFLTPLKVFKDYLNVKENYIKFCLMPGIDNIYNIDPENSLKLELSLNLTFPFKSKRVCIPCKEEISSNIYIIYEHLHNERHIKNLQQLEKNDVVHSKNKPDAKESDLDLATLYMQRGSNNHVQCLACNVTINSTDIQSHIETSDHATVGLYWQTSSKEIFEKLMDITNSAWYYAEKYFCQLCGVKFGSDINFIVHLRQESHLQRVCEAAMDGDTLQFDVCALCQIYLYGKLQDFECHDSSNYHQCLQNITLNLSATSKDLLESHESKIDALLEECHHFNRRNIEIKILKTVERIAKSRYPKVKAYLFGPRYYSVTPSDSDIDIYLDCENNYNATKSVAIIKKQLFSIMETFQTQDEVWRFLKIDSIAGIPHLKFYHNVTDSMCNIYCLNGHDVERSIIMRYLVNADPICHKLILFVNQWIDYCELSGLGGLSTFNTTCIAVFYLQIKDTLPSVWKFLITESDQQMTLSKQRPVDISNYSVKDLLIDFFLFYAEFQYDTDVICPFLGKVIKKRAFVNAALPEEMNVYKSLYEKGATDIFRFNSALCIQDFVELSQNLTRTVTKKTVRAFRQYCLESANILMNPTKKAEM